MFGFSNVPVARFVPANRPPKSPRCASATVRKATPQATRMKIIATSLMRQRRARKWTSVTNQMYRYTSSITVSAARTRSSAA